MMNYMVYGREIIIDKPILPRSNETQRIVLHPTPCLCPTVSMQYFVSSTHILYCYYILYEYTFIYCNYIINNTCPLGLAYFI